MGGASGSRDPSAVARRAKAECAPDDKLRNTDRVTAHAKQADGFREGLVDYATLIRLTGFARPVGLSGLRLLTLFYPGYSLELMFRFDGINHSKQRPSGGSACGLIAEDARGIIETIGGFGI
jgi:hypothetical protein